MCNAMDYITNLLLFLLLLLLFFLSGHFESVTDYLALKVMT